MFRKYRRSAPARSAGPRPRSQQRGQSAVEIAVLLPILLILVFGIAMSGFMFYAYIQVSNAAREGARAGSLYRSVMGNTTDTLDTVVKKAIYNNKGTPATSDDVSTLGGLPVTSTNPTVVVTSSGDKANPRPGDKITVSLNYSYTQPILSAFGPAFPQPLVIQRNVMMEMQ